MSNEQWNQILDKINKQHPHFGSLTLKLVYHENQLVKYEVSKSETTIIKEGENNGKWKAKRMLSILWEKLS